MEGPSKQPTICNGGSVCKKYQRVFLLYDTNMAVLFVIRSFIYSDKPFRKIRLCDFILQLTTVIS